MSNDGSMKLGIFSLTYERLASEGVTTVEMAELAKEQGFEAFEPYPYKDFQTVDAAIRLKQVTEKCGLVIPCFSTAVDLMGDGAHAEMERMKLYIEMASAMGSPYFHHTIHPQLGVDKNTPSIADALDEVIPRLKELCKYAAERNVTCLYEEQGMLFNGVAACRRLEEEMIKERKGMKQTGPGVNTKEAYDHIPHTQRPDFGFCLDAGNIYFVDERPADFAVAFPHRIKHVHLKDYYIKSGSCFDPGDGWLKSRRGDYLRDAIPGHGDVDYVRLMRLIRNIGYDGYFSLEYCGPESLDYALPQSINNLKRFYDSCASDAH